MRAMAVRPTDAPDLAALRQLASAHPTRGDLRFKLAGALGRAGEHDEALRTLVSIDGPDAPPPWIFQRGLAHFRLAQWTEAEAAFRRAFTAEPERADWSAWRARALMAAGDFDAAGQALEEAVALQPGKAAFALLLARTHLRQGRVGDAGKVVEAALAHIDPADPLAGRLGAMRPMVRLAEARSHVLHGVTELRATRWRLAVKAFDRALKLAPDQTPWRVLRARALLGGKELQAAQAELAAAAAADPRAATHALLSTVRQQLGDAAGARQSAEQAVALDPGGPAWRAKLAGLQLVAGDVEAAVDGYRKALAFAPEHAAWRLGLARALLKAGDAAAARAELADIAARPSATPGGVYLLGAVEAQLGDPAAAIAAWRRAISLAGRAVKPSWRARLAGVLAAQGFELDAVAELERAVASPQAGPAIRAQLAQLYWRLADAPAALVQIERAIAGDSDPPFKWTIMADEIRGRLAGGGGDDSRAVSVDYADSFYRSSKVQAAPAEQSPYFGFWQEVAAAVRRSGACRMLDLGCGPGQFAEFITAAAPGMTYTGVDFSGVAVAQARARVPGATFVQADLSRADALEGLDYDLVTALEVLEHIDLDREVLGRLRPGVRIVASVPNFDSFGHVRFFKDAGEVRARYAPFIAELEVTPFQLSPTAILFLMCGVVA
jgi:predicted Zn-dependent protease